MCRSVCICMSGCVYADKYHQSKLLRRRSGNEKSVTIVWQSPLFTLGWVKISKILSTGEAKHIVVLTFMIIYIYFS